MNLEELSPKQWEEACDGCARCCLLVVDGRRTNIACPHLDIETRRCTVYKNRHEVPWCGAVTPKTIDEWLPETCAYRRLKDDKPLAEVHKLIARSGRLLPIYGADVELLENE